MSARRRIVRFVLVAVTVESILAVAIFTVWAALAVGHSGIANLRTATALCIGGALLAVAIAALDAIDVATS